MFRFVPGKANSLQDAKLGRIEKEKSEDIINFFKARVFNVNGKGEKTVKTVNSNTNDVNPCCSTSVSSEPDEVLFVDLPKEIKPQPKPRPRKPIQRHTKTLSLMDLSTCSDFTTYNIFTDDMNIDSNTASKPTKDVKKLPLRPPKPSSRPRTAIRRKKLEGGSLTNLDEQSMLENNDEYETIINPEQMTENPQSGLVYRIAPAPPSPTTKPRKKSVNYTPMSKLKPFPPKKLPAPLPPTIPSKSGMLKADILKVFDIHKQGSKGFCGSPQGVAMTETNIAILDSDEQQVVLFNTEGFYKSRFKVHIPNQGN